MDATPSSQEKPSRRHHYIPQWHLRLFSPNGDTIWRYSKSDDAYQEIPIRHAAVRKDYYSVPGRDGDPVDHSAEPMIAEAFDGPAAGTARKLLRREHLTPEERLQFAAYIALLQGRGPTSREGVQGVFDKIDRMVAMMAYAAPPEQFLAQARGFGIDGTAEEIREMQETGLEDLRTGRMSVSRDHSATMFFAGVTVEAATPILDSMYWTMLQAPIGLEFVLADSPVTLYNHTLVGSMLGVGFGQPEVEVRTPLTPHHVLMQTHLRLPTRELTCSMENVVNLNCLSWRMADDYVFGRSEAVLRRVATYFASDDERRQPGRGISVTGADID